MRDDVLSNELHRRLGADYQALRGWFRSLRPEERLRLVTLMEGEIEQLQGQPDEAVVRKDRLQVISRLFADWMQSASA